MEIKKGDIFYTSWGYDQTNYDYIIIESISPTGKTVLCRRTGHIQVGVTGTDNIQKPENKPFGDSFRLRIKLLPNNEFRLVGSYPFLHTGTGDKRSDWFTKAKDNAVYYETDSLFGH